MSAASTFKARFAIQSEERFAALANAYDHIRKCKAKNAWPDTKEEWLSHFDSKALSHFWWPTSAELKDWEEAWFSTPISRRFTDPSLRRPWDFMSFFEAFKNGDYELRPIERISVEEAVIPFDPHGYPYGGTGCLRALIEAFEHRVTEEPE